MKMSQLELNTKTSKKKEKKAKAKRMNDGTNERTNMIEMKWEATKVYIILT